MLCIASFIVFAILGIFSLSYRQLAGKAWYCLVKKIQFKPCDINFNEELKGKMLGKLIFTHPRLAKFLNKWIDWLSLLFIILSVWSLFSVLISGLNLLVYDTCSPYKAESCSLAGEACGLNKQSLPFFQAVSLGLGDDWVIDRFKTLGETITRVPSRFKTWEPTAYTNQNNSYYFPFDEQKQTALEIIDPGCQFCAKLLNNIKEAGFENKYNLTYLAYPIASDKPGAYKFKHSYLIAQYLEALKIHPLPNRQNPADWILLETILLGQNQDGFSWQSQFNELFNREQAEQQIHLFLLDFGFSSEQIQTIATLAQSEEVADRLAQNRRVVEEQIKTIKIPTILFDGRRYDRVIDAKTLLK